MFNSTFHILLNVSQCFTSSSECVEAMPGCLTHYFTFYSVFHNIFLHVQNVLRLCQDALLNI